MKQLFHRLIRKKRGGALGPSRRTVRARAVGLILASFSLSAASHARPRSEDVHWVILAGGSGTRLWPLSRADKPKQFLELTEGSLIRQSLARLTYYPEHSKTHVVLSTGEKLLPALASLVTSEGLVIGDVITEPGRRDTGPAILLAAMSIYEKNPAAYLMFLPADPYIAERDYPLFGSYLEEAMAYLEGNDKIVLLGKKPEYPATGFGYIEYEVSSPLAASQARPIVAFHEKPDIEIAQQFVGAPNMLWNMGIFAGRAATFIRLFQKYAPSIYEGVEAYRAGTGRYDAIEKRSIDFAVMEPGSHQGELAVLPVDGFSWNDVGNIDTFLHIQRDFRRERSLAETALVQHKGEGNLALSSRAKKLVVTVGVEGLCIVDTDDVLLVSRCSAAEDVRGAVDKMAEMPERFGPYL